MEGYKDIDPIHPRGGKDGGKDILCTKGGIKFIAACYFPRGQKPFKKISDKFNGDLDGAIKNNTEGIVFVTNQEVKDSKRENLKKKVGSIKFDLLHLERIAHILNTPQGYGIRREFLDIEMNEEERVAYAPHNLSNRSGSAKTRVKTGIFHSCSACRFEYVIDDPFNLLAGQLESQRLVRKQLTFIGMDLHFSHKSIVTTCPKCGNIDEVV